VNNHQSYFQTINGPFGKTLESSVGWPYHMTEGIGECTKCPGDLVASNTSTLCQACPSGKYVSENNTHCIFCPYNHTMAMNVSSTKENCVCISGYEKISFFKCKPCSAGIYSAFINSTCIPCPPGSFVPHVGMNAYSQCTGNFVSTTPGATFCVPCPWNMVSNHQNTMCIPENSIYEKIPTIYSYVINFFCVDPDNHGILGYSNATILTKMNTSKWDHKSDIIAKFQNFRYENKSFLSDITTQKCANSFLHSMPVECPFHMFVIRKHSYIWDCVSCPSGKFKTTLGTSYSECIQCTNEECLETKDICLGSEQIVLHKSNSNFCDFYQKI